MLLLTIKLQHTRLICKYSLRLQILKTFPVFLRVCAPARTTLRPGSSSVESQPEATGLALLTVVSVSPASALLVISTVLRTQRRQPWPKLCGRRPEWRALSSGSGRWPHVGRRSHYLVSSAICDSNNNNLYDMMLSLSFVMLRKPVPLWFCTGCRRLEPHVHVLLLI